MLDAADNLSMIFGSICVDEFLKVNTLFVVHGGSVRFGAVRCGAVRVYTTQIVFRLLSNAMRPILPPFLFASIYIKTR